MGGGPPPSNATQDTAQRAYSDKLYKSYYGYAKQGQRGKVPGESSLHPYVDPETALNGQTPDWFYIQDGETKDAYQKRLQSKGFGEIDKDFAFLGDLPSSQSAADAAKAKAAPDLTDTLLKQRAAQEMDLQRSRRGRVSTFLGGGAAPGPTTKKTLLGG